MSLAEDTTFKELFVIVMGRCIRTNCEVAVLDMCREFTWSCP